MTRLTLFALLVALAAGCSKSPGSQTIDTVPEAPAAEGGHGTAAVEVLFSPASFDRSNLAADDAGVSLAFALPSVASRWADADAAALREAVDVVRATDRTLTPAELVTTTAPAPQLGEAKLTVKPDAATPSAYVAQLHERRAGASRPFAVASKAARGYGWTAANLDGLVYPQSVFTVGSCPHVRWVEAKTRDGGVEALQLGLSEPVAADVLRANLTVTSAGQAQAPTVDVSDTPATGPVATLTFAQPLPAGQPFNLNVAQAAKSVAGGAFAGRFADALSCEPSDFTLATDRLVASSKRTYLALPAMARLLEPRDDSKP